MTASAQLSQRIRTDLQVRFGPPAVCAQQLLVHSAVCCLDGGTGPPPAARPPPAAIRRRIRQRIAWTHRSGRDVRCRPWVASRGSVAPADRKRATLWSGWSRPSGARRARARVCVRARARIRAAHGYAQMRACVWMRTRAYANLCTRFTVAVRPVANPLAGYTIVGGWAYRAARCAARVRATLARAVGQLQRHKPALHRRSQLRERSEIAVAGVGTSLLQTCTPRAACCRRRCFAHRDSRGSVSTFKLS